MYGIKKKRREKGMASGLKEERKIKYYKERTRKMYSIKIKERKKRMVLRRM